MRVERRNLGSAILATLFAAGTAMAQTYGIATQETIIPAQTWVPASGGYSFNGGGSITPAVNGAQTWVVPVGVPSGAVISSIDFLISDNDAGSDITMGALLSTFPVGGVGSCGGIFASADSGGVNGLGTVTMTNPYGTSPLRYRGQCNGVDSYENYYLSVTLQTTSHTLWGARVSWNRTVSTPGGQTFTDVPPSDTGFAYIEALAASGITGGCGGGNYCPDSNLTRRQMAIFIAKALGLYFPQ